LIFQLSYVSRVREHDEIPTAHSSHTHHRPKTKHCSHRGAIVCAAAVVILTRASGVRQCQGASSSSSGEQGAVTDGAEAPSFAPAQSMSSREQVTTDDAEAPHHCCAIRGQPTTPDDLIIVTLRVLPTAPRHWDTGNACRLMMMRMRGGQVISLGE
jgi:hypothetical protein